MYQAEPVGGEYIGGYNNDSQHATDAGPFTIQTISTFNNSIPFDIKSPCGICPSGVKWSMN